MKIDWNFNWRLVKFYCTKAKREREGGEGCGRLREAWRNVDKFIFGKEFKAKLTQFAVKVASSSYNTLNKCKT